MKTIIHVNQHIIRNNRKTGRNDPPIIVRNYKGIKHAHHVEIDGPATVIGAGVKLSCGARVWIETRSNVDISCVCCVRN